MKKLYFIILAIVMFLPKINIINIPGTYVGIRLEDIIIALYALIFVVCLLNGHRFSKEVCKVSLLFFFYWIICFISDCYNFISSDLSIVKSTLYFARKFEYFILIYAGYDYIRNMTDIRRLLNLIDASVIYHMIIVALQFAGIMPIFSSGTMIWVHDVDRTFSIFNGPYEFAGYLMMVSTICSYRLVKGQNIGKNSVLLFIDVVLLFMTKSRISLVAAILVDILICIKFSKNILKLLLKVFGGIIIAVICFAVFEIGTDKMFERFSTIDIKPMVETTKATWENRDFEQFVTYKEYHLDRRFIAQGTDESYAIRISKWCVLLEGFIRHPLLGYGQSFALEAADGQYVRTLAESGLLGLASWVSMCIFILRISKKDGNKELAMLIGHGMLSLMITAIFIDIFEASKIMMFYWFVCGAFLKTKVVEESNTI